MHWLGSRVESWYPMPGPTNDSTNGPMSGLVVLDLTTGVAGPYATKLLADYGARVIKAEPRGGDPTRQFGPFPKHEADIEASGLFLHLNTNKQSIVLDPHTDDGAATVRRLAQIVDVIVEDLPPDEPAQAGWGWQALHAINPRLILCSITPYGQTGPYRSYRGSELTMQAIGGPFHATGAADREPIKVAGHYASYHAGATAAFAILLALRRIASDVSAGDWIDISIYRCQVGCRDRRTNQLVSAEYSSFSPGRAQRQRRQVGFGMYPCADGFVNIVGSGNRMPRMLRWVGREDLLQDEAFLGGPRPGSGFGAKVDEAVESYLASRTKLDAVAEAQAAGLLAGAVMTTADVLADPQLAARDWWHRITHWHGDELPYPGFPFRMSDSNPPRPKRSPRLGEHSRVVMDFTPPDPLEDIRHPLPEGPSSALHLPLEGIRVAAVTVVWAGPHVAQLLGEWGADVINVEPVNRIQPYTRGAENAQTREAMLRGAEIGVQPQYPDAELGEEPWNRFASFNSHARNKRSMTCDIMSPEGREAFLKLIEQCDVLVENNVPTTIDKANIGWDELRKVNPRLIMLRMPAFGLEGPYASYRAFGLHVEAMVGHTHLRGYPDRGPEAIGETLASDGLSGVQGALAVAMALRHREQTGQGQLIEMPLNEGFIPTLAEYLFEYTMNGNNPPSQGNRHPWRAPYGVYPCRGVDQWIAIDIATDAEFVALCSVLAAGPGQASVQSELAHAPLDVRFAHSDARRQHAALLDDLIQSETQEWNKEDLFHQLQAAGVCAAPLNDPFDALSDRHLREVGFFEQMTVEGVGTHRYPGLTITMNRTPNQLRTPPVRLGEHNREIYLDLLGYSEQELSALEAKGLVGTAYPDELLPAHIRSDQRRPPSAPED